MQVVSARDVEPGWVTVEVTDHGIGVPKGQEELIFEEFHRGPAEGRSAGTGLGLALTRRIIASHGGRADGQAQPGGRLDLHLHLARGLDPTCVDVLPRMAMFCNSPTAIIETNIDDPP